MSSGAHRLWTGAIRVGMSVHRCAGVVPIPSPIVHDVPVVTVKRSVVARKRPGVWRDPRFVVGVVLIVVSVLVCTLLVTRARGGSQHYEVTRQVAVGETLDGTNTRAAEARISSGAYLPYGELPEGAVATRSMDVGELLARAAVSARADVDFRRLMVSVSSGLPDSASPGTVLELWFVPTSRVGGEREAPRLVASDVTLVRVAEATGGIVSQGGTRIEVRLAVGDLPAVLEATGGDGVVTAVPVGG